MCERESLSHHEGKFQVVGHVCSPHRSQTRSSLKQFADRYLSQRLDGLFQKDGGEHFEFVLTQAARHIDQCLPPRSQHVPDCGSCGGDLEEATYGDGGITLRSTGDLSDSDLKGAVETGRAASRGGGSRGDGRSDALGKDDTGSANEGRNDGCGLHPGGGGEWMCVLFFGGWLSE